MGEIRRHGHGTTVLRLAALRLAAGLLVAAGVAGSARAALQFDVFPGFGGVVVEGSWFPMACEVKNDGPAFNGVIQISPLNYGQSSGQVREVQVELPTGTLKRIFIPVFATSRNWTWEVRLLDERGRVRGEQLNLQPSRRISTDSLLLGALSRSPTGVPVFRSPPPRSAGSDAQPMTTRLQPALFPDNPLILEGLGAIYLNSAQAGEIKLNQVDALYGWLNEGGHLIIGAEQISDISSTPWLKALFPCELKGMQTVQSHAELQAWVASNEPAPGARLKAATVAAAARAGPNAAYPFAPGQRVRPGAGGRPANRMPLPVPGPSGEESAPAADSIAPDLAFESAAIPAITGTVLEGQTVLSCEGLPLIVTANRGRGRVTALLFSPEREPFRSWKNLPRFWEKVADVPAGWHTASRVNYGGMSSDGIFGAMLDSRQVHKLPVEWLLLLLLVYLVVIGPLDQYWLKRIRKPMLTWVTFPCYVVLFSLLIYFIGYKLRAGESEWNELHVVDALPNGERAELRGRTYASIYSPSNQRYLLESGQKYATFRNEFAGPSGGGENADKTSVLQKGDSFRAEIFVPVWVNQLYVSDWWQPGEMPITLSVNRFPSGWKVAVANWSEAKLSNVNIVIEDRIFGLEDLAPGANRTFDLARDAGRTLPEFLAGYGGRFREAAQSRKRAFGSTESAHIDDLQNASIAASFPSLLGSDAYTRFVSPPGLDVSPAIEHGSALFLAWAGGYSPVKPINRFSPRRFHQNTLWRVTAPVQ